ncbi:SDR family oxidoreductase [Nocardia donostiensis]|uniref:Short-chain dehydrogenase n=1 Tax=Nocardia donostiensis TaxID=1538463 RepID=A0A1W0AVF2_9NOCA|nr:SDR family oxidoreductase [Nocardia donostiensis]ONM46476.1 short-chain dehydrogenase [Nocardia donostiensis]OQS14267.1 short-chain dehydrogenase [Nocardia donostiensis]OQS18123.1 short-chain dehydrogenase [Nocardia donostiensis]
MDIGWFNPLNLLAGPSYDVRGKTALITGAGQGIGRKVADILYRRGASVALVDVDAAMAGRAASALGERAYSIAADVADRADMQRAVEETVRRFGRLDVVVANAGVTPRPATLRTMDPDEFDRVMAINLNGVFNTVRPALDYVVAARGHVVVVSSCAAFAPGMGGSPYMVSKAGVEQLGRALRVELAAVGASAGVAYFGVVQTQMTRNMLDEDELGQELDGYLPWPLNIRITPEEAARTIADGIARRAARTIAPGGWEPYALLRGVVNVVLDSRLANDTGLHRLIRQLEQRG